MNPTRTIEYFYSPHSAFAYIGAAHLHKILLRSGARLLHRPIDLGLLTEELSGGFMGSRSEKHRAYFFDREIERWAEYRGVPILSHRPSWHDENMEFAACAIIAAQEGGLNADLLSHALLEAHWRDDANIADHFVIEDAANRCGMNGSDLLNKAHETSIRDQYKRNTSEAIARSVFGSPCYFVNGDLFYGQDRLDMVERALETPFAGNWPK